MSRLMEIFIHLFISFPFRKRMTIEDALDHPWIKVCTRFLLLKSMFVYSYSPLINIPVLVVRSVQDFTQHRLVSLLTPVSSGFRSVCGRGKVTSSRVDHIW